MVTGDLTIDNCYQDKLNWGYVEGYCTGVLNEITGLKVNLTLCEDYNA